MDKILQILHGIPAKVYFGVLLAVLAVFIFHMNEGQDDFAAFIKKTPDISSEKLIIDEALKGELVSTTGILVSDQKISDNGYLFPGKYFAVQRKVEMFSFVGKAATSEALAKYKKGWTETPSPAIKENPKKALDSSITKVSSAKIGVWEIDPVMITMPELMRLNLDKKSINVPNNGTLSGNKFLYLGRRPVKFPQIGDLRISYLVLPQNKRVTVFGKMGEGIIAPFIGQKDFTIYRMLFGDRKAAVKKITGEVKTYVWIFRLIGIAFSWLALALLFDPLANLLKVHSLLKSFSQIEVKGIVFLASMIVSFILIMLSIFFRNFTFYLIVIALIAIAGAVALRQKIGR